MDIPDPPHSIDLGFVPPDPLSETLLAQTVSALVSAVVAVAIVAMMICLCIAREPVPMCSTFTAMESK